MRQLNLSAGLENEAGHDEMYFNLWKSALDDCQSRLEHQDHQLALRIKDLQDFRNQLWVMIKEYPDDNSTRAIRLIDPILNHYETFAQNFVRMMKNPVETSMMWGLLFLVFKLALVDRGPQGSLHRITRWLENIGLKFEDSNDCHGHITDFYKVKRPTVQVNKEIINLWLNIIWSFRNGSRGFGAGLENELRHLTGLYDSAYRLINDSVLRIQKFAKMAQKQAEQQVLQCLLSAKQLNQHGGTIPCNNLPFAENQLFFGRRDILLQLEEHLKPGQTMSPLASAALWGLGGIGKTQTALAYAHEALKSLDAVFWISAEDELSIQKSFSHIAVHTLQLPEAQPQTYQENMLRVLHWLQKTSATWLLVFDNVERHDVLNICWPSSKHGAIIVTTRDITIATLPIDRGIEIKDFSVEEGASFLLYMAVNRKCTKDEGTHAELVSRELGGLPLAICQMAAFINARNYSVREFLSLYEKYDQRLHKQRKNGWKYLGYVHALDTVWEISFANLKPEAHSCLGVLSFLSPEQVPSEIFLTTDPMHLPKLLSFCSDEFSLDEAVEELTRHALVRKDLERSTFRVHRLVQAEFRFRMNNKQEHFEAAIALLLEKIPSQRSSKFDNDLWFLYEKYMPQVRALVRNYNQSQQKPEPLKSTKGFVVLLTNSANAIQDNDTLSIVSELVDTADMAFRRCPEEDKDQLLWALLLTLKGVCHFKTSEFSLSEQERKECLEIRRRLLPEGDLLISVALNGVGMALGCQERYEEAESQFLESKVILDGPAGIVESRKLQWGYNFARNCYCKGNYDLAETLLTEAFSIALKLEGWYNIAYGHLTIASLRTRTKEFNRAREQVEAAKALLETSGTIARFSWLSSYCAYRAGDIAMKQGENEKAIEETGRAVAIGNLVNIPVAILSRSTHAFSKALATDPSRQAEAENARLEARKLRSKLPDGGGDLDDESDEAFERLVMMVYR